MMITSSGRSWLPVPILLLNSQLRTKQNQATTIVAARLETQAISLFRTRPQAAKMYLIRSGLSAKGPGAFANQRAIFCSKNHSQRDHSVHLPAVLQGHGQSYAFKSEDRGAIPQLHWGTLAVQTHASLKPPESFFPPFASAPRSARNSLAAHLSHIHQHSPRASLKTEEWDSREPSDPPQKKGAPKSARGGVRNRCV
jgi:hypothetical protein